MAYDIKDHGEWEPYTPETLPEGAPANALFARRKSDGQDWYEYVNPEKGSGRIFSENFGDDTIKFACFFQEINNVYVIGATVTDATMIFPANQIVREIMNYEGTDPIADFRSKAYDPATNEITDQPPIPYTPSPEDQVLFNHENRIRGLEGEPPLTIERFLREVKGVTGPINPV